MWFKTYMAIEMIKANSASYIISAPLCFKFLKYNFLNQWSFLEYTTCKFIYLIYFKKSKRNS